MKIIMLGGTGLLGSEIKKISSEIVFFGFGRINIDITNLKMIRGGLDQYHPDIIINAAAVIDNNIVIQNKFNSIQTNIIGAGNVAAYCASRNIRLVYISSDYVYAGTGNHSEDDAVNPHNLYAYTKLAGECATRLVDNHLIIRTSFGSTKFPYKQAYTNLIVSKDYVDVIAPMILKAVCSSISGVLNIGTHPKTMYEYASKRNIVEKASMPIPKDFSLNTSKYELYFNK